MITIFRLTPGSRTTTSSSTGRFSNQGPPTSMYRVYEASCGMIDRVRSNTDSLQTSREPQDRYGNKNCFHLQLEGSLSDQKIQYGGTDYRMSTGFRNGQRAVPSKWSSRGTDYSTRSSFQCDKPLFWSSSDTFGCNAICIGNPMETTEISTLQSDSGCYRVTLFESIGFSIPDYPYPWNQFSGNMYLGFFYDGSVSCKITIQSQSPYAYSSDKKKVMQVGCSVVGIYCNSSSSRYYTNDSVVWPFFTGKTRSPQDIANACLEGAAPWAFLQLYIDNWLKKVEIMPWDHKFDDWSPASPERVAVVPEERSVQNRIKIAANLQRFIRHCPYDKDMVSVRSTLSSSAINGLKNYQSNLLEYTRDLKLVGDTVKTVLSALGSPVSLVNLSNVWLSLRFGDQLTIRDSLDLISSVGKELSDSMNQGDIVTHARLSSLSTHADTSAWKRESLVYAYQVYTRPDSFSPLGDLMNWGLAPTPKAIWDLIPYSFAVDWLLPTGKALEDLDTWLYSRTMTIRSTLYSAKDVFSLTDDSCEGLRVSRYIRQQSDDFTFVPFSDLSSSASAINVIDGATLLLQRF